MKIGHTGITWGIPCDIEVAYKEVAELGYLGFETFAFQIVARNEEPGGYRALIERFGIPTGAAYTGKGWIDPTRLPSELDEVRREADALKEAGGDTLVVQAGPRPGRAYTPSEFDRLADALHQVGAHCKQIGLACGLHPHTETGVETRADIDAIMRRLDPQLVGFAPDTGQIAKGGADVLDVLRAHADRICHVHLKDWNGTADQDSDGNPTDESGYANYVPVGQGVVPIKAVLDFLESCGYSGWVNVELDGTAHAPRPPKEAAAMSRRYLDAVLQGRVVWRDGVGA